MNDEQCTSYSLLKLIRPATEKQGTELRIAIGAKKKLTIITLTCLVILGSYEELKFLPIISTSCYLIFVKLLAIRICEDLSLG